VLVRHASGRRGEVPARHAYPGYLYSDLAGLYERCGRIRGGSGSVTMLPLLTMPGGDITHPVPDLTGYITEGQVVLSPQAFAQGIYPPVDPLSSLSRLMRRGAGPGRTREDHLDVAAQLLGALAELIGAGALGPGDQAYLAFEDAFGHDFVAQRADELRSLEETLDRAWRALGVLPRRELTMLPSTLIDAYLGAGHG
jgi:V/A-type H+/Na+-transporting ATPase subunit B